MPSNATARSETDREGLRRLGGRESKSGDSSEMCANRLQVLAVFDPRRTEARALRLHIRIEMAELRGVVEHLPAVVVHEALSGRAFRKNHLVGVELEMVVADADRG